MNKAVPLLIGLLIISTGALWYTATKSPQSRIRCADLLVVGTNAEYAPFSFMKEDIITGFDIDLINEVAKRMNKTVDLHEMPFDALINALQTGSIEVIASGITPTAERAQRVFLTRVYLKGDPLVIVSPINAPIKKVEQLKGKNVAVNEGYTADYYLSKIEGPTITRFASPLESFMALESGRVAAFVSAKNAIKPFLEHYGAHKFSVTPIENTNDEYALAISKKYPDLVEPIQTALDAIEADGTLDTLKKKWNLE